MKTALFLHGASCNWLNRDQRFEKATALIFSVLGIREQKFFALLLATKKLQDVNSRKTASSLTAIRTPYFTKEGFY
jgi:hypothetical protein